MFEHGQIIKTFTSKKGNTVVLRYPKKEDVQALLDFINQLSREDTFILFSGQQLTLEEEVKYLDSVLESIEKRTQAYILPFIGEKLVGACGLTRRIRRMSHIGDIHISVAKDYREEGIGREMLLTIIDEAKKMELKMLGIQVFANNPRAEHLYKSIGFIKHGRFPKAVQYKGQLIDEIEMHLNL